MNVANKGNVVNKYCIVILISDDDRIFNFRRTLSTAHTSAEVKEKILVVSLLVSSSVHRQILKFN